MITHLYFLVAFMALCAAICGVWFLIGGLDELLAKTEADEGDAVLLDKVPTRLAPCNIGVCADFNGCACRVFTEPPIHTPTPSGTSGHKGAEQRVRNAAEWKRENEGREYW